MDIRILNVISLLAKLAGSSKTLLLQSGTHGVMLVLYLYLYLYSAGPVTILNGPERESVYMFQNISL